MARKMKTMDGNHAAAHASYAFTDVAAIYPITPSSPCLLYTSSLMAQGTFQAAKQEILETFTERVKE